MSKGIILSSTNTALKVSNIFGAGNISPTATLSGVPLGTADGTATGQLGAKVIPIGNFPVVPPQSSGVPSSFTVATTDATVFTLAAGEVGFIQNLDDAALAVKKGASASTVSFNFLLKAGAAADDGTGGYVVIDDWIGVVSVAAMAGSPRYIAWKQTI